LHAAGLVQPGSAQTLEPNKNNKSVPMTCFKTALVAGKRAVEAGVAGRTPNGVVDAMTRILGTLIYKKSTNFHYFKMNLHNFSTNEGLDEFPFCSNSGHKKTGHMAGF